ncbi:sigma 54-interacting transcriptional regulator [Irregularibacter muris]|uniref:Sigma 54-interacting transcriptional regulator n=1 Tax=Irregularibacter muris TaxID=1796619 RepID=A0AAE3L058_9FIRM|nr:sigma 54-interacting transcriptional regulator [Irregularibacter muris]MCR1899327.1 sigma 54-interacting transcriptional regulator [Irregularibacter muris]
MENRKKIAMISMDYSVNIALTEQLNEVFQKEVEVVPILLDEKEVIPTEGLDLMVCTSRHLVQTIKEKITKTIPIIPVRRTINLKNITEVISINTGQRVFLVNNQLFTAKETIHELKKVGIDHINFIPYYPGCDAEIVDIAVTPGGTHLVPPGVKRIIDIGVRIIDISSIIEIFLQLNLPLKDIQILSERYSKEMVQANRYNIETNKILKATFEVTNDGIAALDVSGNLFFVNEKFAKLLGYEQTKMLSRNIVEIISNKKIIDSILSLEYIDHEIVDINNKKFMLNKTLLYQGSILKGYVLGLQEIVHIQNLEKEVRQKLFKKGFVAKYNFNDLVGVSKKLIEQINIAKKVAKSDLTVLIQGQDGTGKEIFAQAIHKNSMRKNEPFVAVNFAAISESLLESQLFGYEEGAFTGASKGGRAGLFEQADKGTIFIDEIGDTSPQIQIRLLRVLQEKEIMRVGGSKIIPIDVRVIAATNKNLLELVEQQKFRKDLYYRLKVLYLNVPTLQERKEDISLLAKYFFKNLGSNKKLTKEVEEIFLKYSWPGNIRELENLIYFIDNIVESEWVSKEDLPGDFIDGIDQYSKGEGSPPGEIDFNLLPLEDMKDYIAVLKVLDNTKELGMKLGRNKISEILKSIRIDLSPQQVRLRLKDLEKIGFVKVRSTKQGSMITEKGRHFLTDWDNKN